MMSLIFCLYLISLLLVLKRHPQFAIGCFVGALVISLIWFKRHASETLQILL